MSVIRRDQAGRLIDHWGNHYIYSREGDASQLISYGRDGVPGGRGLDLDIEMIYDPLSGSAYPKPKPDDFYEQLNEHGWEEKPPLYAFFFKYQTEGLRLLFFLCGAFGVLVTFCCTKEEIGASGKIGKIIIGIVLTLICSWFMSVTIGQAHIPSGH